MRKIILTVILSSFLPALAVAETKTMQNTHKSASDVDVMKQGKHMMNTKKISQSDINMEKKHMSMGDNPFPTHEKKAGQKTNQKHKGYTVNKYKK